MKLGLFTPVFGDLDLHAMLAKVKALGKVEAIEIGTGGWPGSDHIDPDALLNDKCRAREYRDLIADAELTISALSCHGNPLHPDRNIAKQYDEIFRRTVCLAQRLEVPVVVTFSGCPGDADGAKHPNWICTPWPPECLDVLAWQWERGVQYWEEAAAFAANHGVKVAIEAHPGFLVYNVETMLKLRSAAGASVGINFDPSHLYWQGVDMAAAIRALTGAIFHVHAKDIAIDRQKTAINGVLDAKSYRRLQERSWLFRSVGWGHDELEWKRIISALRLAGYDYVVSIEHEDALASVDEGLRSAVTLLSQIIPGESAVEPWWT